MAAHTKEYADFAVQPLQHKISFREPETMQELYSVLSLIGGRSIAELAALAGVDLPYGNKTAKGYTGQLTEIFLGATAGNLSLPDLRKLNIEVKTLPVNGRLQSVESTFICSAELTGSEFVPFRQSALFHKISRVLFIPVLAPAGCRVAQRRILGHFFFTPGEDELLRIEEDYKDFADLVMSGRADEITGDMGNIIQMRPKAASGNSLTPIRNSEGDLLFTRPKAFYLRASYTSKLCRLFREKAGCTAMITEAYSAFERDIKNSTD